MRDSYQPRQKPADELARGYSEIWFPADPDHGGGFHKLLVPDELRDALQAEAEAFAGEVKAGEKRQHAPAPVPSSEPEPQRWSGARTPARGTVFEQEAIWQAYSAATAARRDFHPIFEPSQAVALYQRMLRYAEEDRTRFAIVYDRLKDLGHLRAMAHPDVAALEQLRASQPHMAPIVEFVRDQIELARHSSRPLRLAPMLLTGESGIGKTHFAQSLAKALRAPLSIQRLDTDLTSSLLLGSDCNGATHSMACCLNC